MIEQVGVDLSSDDNLVWKHSTFLSFSVKDVYCLLLGSVFTPHWSKYVWKSFIPLSKSLQCSQLLNRKMPLDKVFLKNGFSLLSQCCICMCHEDTPFDLFTSFHFVAGLWDFLTTQFGFSISHNCDPVDLLLKAIDLVMSPQVFNLWIATLVSVFSTIQQACNKAFHYDILLLF